jgi:uncharacterized protein
MHNSKTLVVLLAVLMLHGCTQAQPEIAGCSAKLNTSDNSLSIGSVVTLYSKILGEEKEIYISLPPLYEEHVQSYPIIFALEAEFLFESTRTIAHMMAARSKMPESIIVGIANGEFDKRHEFSYERWGGKPDLYASFFKEELIPYLKNNYRVNDHKAIIGLSPSAGFLYESFVRNPGLFQSYIALSAHLEWDRVQGTKLLDEITAKNNDSTYPETVFYLGRAASDFETFSGSEEEYDRAQELLKSYEPDKVKLVVDVFGNDEHYLMSLAGIRAGLTATYPNEIWRNPGTPRFEKSADYANELFKDYYDQLSSIYGFDIHPVETAHGYGFSPTGMIRSAKKWGTPQQAKDLIELGVSYFPNSAHLHMELAKSYAEEGDLARAKLAAEKAITLAAKYNSKNVESYNKQLRELE